MPAFSSPLLERIKAFVEANREVPTGPFREDVLERSVDPQNAQLLAESTLRRSSVRTLLRAMETSTNGNVGDGVRHRSDDVNWDNARCILGVDFSNVYYTGAFDERHVTYLRNILTAAEEAVTLPSRGSSDILNLGRKIAEAAPSLIDPALRVFARRARVVQGPNSLLKLIGSKFANNALGHISPAIVFANTPFGQSHFWEIVHQSRKWDDATLSYLLALGWCVVKGEDTYGNPEDARTFKRIASYIVGTTKPFSFYRNAVKTVKATVTGDSDPRTLWNNVLKGLYEAFLPDDADLYNEENYHSFARRLSKLTPGRTWSFCSHYGIVHDTESHSVGRAKVCDYAFRNEFQRCPECGEIEYRGSFRTRTVRGRRMRVCSDCAEAFDHSEDSILPYGTDVNRICGRVTPDKWFGESGSKWFLGVELEINARTRLSGGEYVTREMTADWVRDTAGRDALICAYDGSLSENGFEIIGVPVTHEYAVSEGSYWRKLLKANASERRIEGWRRSECGMHVHVSKAALPGDSELAKFVLFIHNPENVKFVTAISGRNFNQYSTRADKTRKTALRSDSRYEAVNTNTRSGKTYEVRIFQSNVSEFGFLKNLDFVTALVELANMSAYYRKKWGIDDPTHYSALIRWIERDVEARDRFKYLSAWLVKHKWLDLNASTVEPTLAAERAAPETLDQVRDARYDEMGLAA